MDDTKTAIRERLRDLRDALGDDQRRRAGASICERVVAHPMRLGCRRVGLYATFGSEVPTEPLHEAFCWLGVEVVYPRVHRDASGRRALDFVAVVGDPAGMRPGSYGIREPDGPAIELGSIDLVIVPGLGFDRRGARLGYGGGYYDRTLAHFAGRCFGIGYSCQLVDRLPVRAHDRLVDVVITENDVIDVVDAIDVIDVMTAATGQTPGRGLI